ncbi:MAG TPA: hypothetical protein VMQ48_01060 [Candidatus Saccharimonadales bacterium]|nr:hypothetical protein [Candidatus Saccharimonadales bacterium]
MSKKIFAISTLLLVLVVGAIFVYNFAFKKPAASTNSNADKATAKTAQEGMTPDKTTAQADTPKTSPTSNLSVSAVSDEPVFGAALSADGNSLYYFLRNNGQLNQADLNGKLEKVLSTEKFTNLKKITWNKPKNKVIIKTESAPGKSKFLYFDIPGKKVSVLKENLDSVAWSNLGDKIIYKYYDPKTKKRTVSTADPDGKNWTDLTEFNYQGVEISPIPSSSDISFWPSPNAFTPTSVNSISFGGGAKKEILKDKFGADLLWSPDGSQAAVSFTDQKGGHKTELALMNSQGGEFQSLGFATFATKCAWSTDSKYLFCALPGNIPDTAILPDDWQASKISTSDTFWKVEAATGKKDRLVDPEKIGGTYDALFPFLSKDEKSLFFVNKADGKLYKLDF